MTTKVPTHKEITPSLKLSLWEWDTLVGKACKAKVSVPAYITSLIKADLEK